MKYPATALAVFMAHLMLLASLTTYTASAPPPPPPPTQGGSSDVKVASDSPVTVKPLSGDGSIHTTGDECTSKKYYVGLGLRYWPNLGYVTMVGHNTPAANAGIQMGDVLLDGPDVDTLAAGTRIVLHIMRGSKPMTFHLTVAKICQE